MVSFQASDLDDVVSRDEEVKAGIRHDFDDMLVAHIVFILFNQLYIYWSSGIEMLLEYLAKVNRHLH